MNQPIPLFANAYWFIGHRDIQLKSGGELPPWPKDGVYLSGLQTESNIIGQYIVGEVEKIQGGWGGG